MRRSWPLVNSVCLWRSPISKLLALRALFIVRPNYYRRVTVTDRLESKKSTRKATQENRTTAAISPISGWRNLQRRITVTKFDLILTYLLT